MWLHPLSKSHKSTYIKHCGETDCVPTVWNAKGMQITCKMSQLKGHTIFWCTLIQKPHNPLCYFSFCFHKQMSPCSTCCHLNICVTLPGCTCCISWVWAEQTGTVYITVFTQQGGTWPDLSKRVLGLHTCHPAICDTLYLVQKIRFQNKIEFISLH